MSLGTMFTRAFGGSAGTIDAARAATTARHQAITADLSVVELRRASATPLPYHVFVEHTVTPGTARVPVADPSRSTAQAAVLAFGAGPGIVDRAAGAGQLLRSPSREHVARIERVLTHGEPLPLSVRRTAISHANGTLARVDLLDPADDGASALPAFRKPPMQAAQERFGWRLLDTLGAGYLTAPVAMRSDGSALVAAVDGAPMSAEGVGSYADLEALHRSWYDLHMPQLPEADRAQAARVDRQLTQFADWFTANSDRSGGNGLADARSSEGTVIDWGNAGVGERPDALRPGLSHAFTDANERVQLDPATLAVIRARLTPQAVSQLHAELAGALAPEAAANTSTPPLFRGMNAFLGSPRYHARLQARLDHVLATGWIEGSAGGVRPRPELL